MERKISKSKKKRPPRKPQDRPPSPATSGKRDELKYHGLHACDALWRHRPEAVIRVYVTEERLKEMGPLLKWCAAQKKAYHVVTAADLEKIASSVHHEGVCILARAPVVLSGDALLEELVKTKGNARECLIYLDGVQNPHNIGSIIRAAAHFGVTTLVGRSGQLPALTGAAARVAEGGAELVRLAAVDDAVGFFLTLKRQGFRIITTSSHKGQATKALYEVTLPAKVVFILGAEVHGVSTTISRAADESIAIPGSGAVESLNVAIATALLMAEHWRQGRQSHQGQVKK